MRGASLSLTAPERETVITFSDGSDTATIHTHQRHHHQAFEQPGCDQG
jgi:hypothetical protein